jgi:hypothetical protein
VVLPQLSETVGFTRAVGAVGAWLQPRANIDIDATVSVASTRLMDRSPIGGLS